MIAADQPTIFPANVQVAISSVEDGSMKDGIDLMTPKAVRNREAFLTSFSMSPQKAAVFFASFETDDYCVYEDAVSGLIPGVDGVATNRANVPILLPLADCVGAVVYDPAQHALMVSHLGRHSTEQDGGAKTIVHMTERYGSQPDNLLVWLGPSPNGTDYPLWAFNNRSFIDVLTEQLCAAGVKRRNVEISHVDTTVSPHYFSHSQHLKGLQEVDGRYAIVAMLK